MRDLNTFDYQKCFGWLGQNKAGQREFNDISNLSVRLTTLAKLAGQVSSKWFGFGWLGLLPLGEAKAKPKPSWGGVLDKYIEIINEFQFEVLARVG